MRFAALLLTLLVLLSACSEPASEPGLIAIVGGRLEPSLDAEPIEYSVIVIAQGKFRAVGPQATTPVPKGAETISAKGKLIRPMPYTSNISEGEPAGLFLFDVETGAPERLMQDGVWVQ